MIFHRLALSGALGTLLATAGCLSSAGYSPRADAVQSVGDRAALATSVIAYWQDVSALAARRLMEEYGAPDEVRHDRLVWNRAGPWTRTVVREKRPAAALEDSGVIEQTVEHPLTPGQAADVAAFDGRLSYNARAGELTARSDRGATACSRRDRS